MARSDLIQSLLRGMEILERIAWSKDGMRLKDVSEALQLKTPTAHNLLKTLASKAYIERNGDQQYRLGPAFRELLRTGQEQRFWQAAEETVERLWRALPQSTVTFTVRSGEMVCVRLRISPERPGVVQQPEQRFFSLYGSASGLTFLAFSSDDEKLALMGAHPFYEKGVALWGTLEALEEALGAMREARHVLLPFPEPHMRVAAPIPQENGTPAGALGVSLPGVAPENETLRNDVIETLLREAEGLSNQL